MEHIKFLVKVNNVMGYLLIASIVFSPIGFIQVLLGHLVLMMLQGNAGKKEKYPDHLF